MTAPKTLTQNKKLYHDLNLQIIFCVTLIAIMGVASLTPVFPKVIEVFHISSQAVGFLITVFTLPGVILTPIFGVLADRWGRKKILVPSLFLFALAGSACALVRDFQVLLILRFFQGVGAASLGSLNVTIIGDLYSGKARGSAMGYNASVLSLGTGSYPAIGGALAMFSWHFPFLLPLLAIPVGLLVLLRLKNPEPKSRQLLSEYLRQVWRSISLQVICLLAASTITFIILYGSYLTYYPLLINQSFGGSSLIIGLIMSIMSITTAIASAQLTRLIQMLSERSLIKISFLLYGLALLIIPFVPNIWLLLIPSVIFGIAHGINLPSIQTLLAGLATVEHRAAFMSVNGMVLRLGQTLGPILIGLFYTFGGLHCAFYGGAMIAVGMFVATSIIMK